MFWIIKTMLGLLGSALALALAVFVFLFGSMAMSGDDLSTPLSRVMYAALCGVTLLIGIGGVIMVWVWVIRLPF